MQNKFQCAGYSDEALQAGLKSTSASIYGSL